MNNKTFSSTPPRRQRGVAILVITILLLLVATIGTITVGRVGMMEQKAVGTDVRSKEVYSAATGGLEYGVGWFEQNYEDLEWQDTNGSGSYDAGDTAVLPDGDTPGNAEANADNYGRSITYTLRSEALDEWPVIVTVSSTATAENDSHVNKTVAVDVMLGVTNLFSPVSQGGESSIFDGPPIMVETCMSGIHGNPDVHPNGGVAIGTTRGLNPDLDGEEDETLEDCLDEGHLNLNGGSERALSPPRPLWDTVFGAGVTEATLREKEARDPTQVYFVDDSYPRYDNQPSWNGNTWHFSLGSAENPVILYFDSSVGCPRINGGPTIYGLVYYEQELDDDGEPVCSFEGWGGATIHGTVAVEGDMTGFNANGEVNGRALDFGGDEAPDDDNSIDIRPTDNEHFSEIPGSWRDF